MKNVSSQKRVALPLRTCRIPSAKNPNCCTTLGEVTHYHPSHPTEVLHFALLPLLLSSFPFPNTLPSVHPFFLIGTKGASQRSVQVIPSPLF